MIKGRNLRLSSTYCSGHVVGSLFCLGAYVTDRPLCTSVEQQASTVGESSTSAASVASDNQMACDDDASTTEPASPPQENQPLADKLSSAMPASAVVVELCSISTPPPTQCASASPSSSEQSPSTSLPKLVCPDEIRPFPKAGGRKATGSRACQRKGDTRILTDTPVKLQLQLEQQASNEKKEKR